MEQVGQDARRRPNANLQDRSRMPGHRDDCQMRPDLDCLAELRIIDEIEFEDCEGITVLPGVEQVLSALPKERWVVVTSATERVARARLAAGGIAAPARFIHAESVTQGKPHPAPYLAGAALLGYKPENCVVFEDAASGSRQAGLPAARWWRRRFRILSSR